MDCRHTLRVNETFIELLNGLLLSNEMARLLVDDGGIARVEGQVKNIDVAHGTIELDTGGTIELKKIVAVNGVFLPEYGEC